MAVRVLLWKNWRVKQRESRLNRGRAGGAWLFPALLTDVVLPLALVLLLIRKICEYNASMATPSGASDLSAFPSVQMGRALAWQAGGAARAPEHKRSALLMAALPLLLRQSNQSLAVIDRLQTRAFLNFLDRYQ